MFRWFRKLLGMRTYTKHFWYVEAWESEYDLDHGSGSMIGPFKTERKAMDYAKKHFDEGLWNCNTMWRP